jgi:acetolactate synthase-1/2/3 large subunit
MNGAESLLETLGHNGIEVCFANPGTSEMHFVAALDRQPHVRGVLGLFEGIVTGAADGYSRMLDKPAATLLHLGPGAANGLSALHNALRARTSIVNIIGDHAGYHRGLDAPLTSDIEGALRPFSNWVRTSPSANSIAADAADAIGYSLPGRISSLILPADTAWNDADEYHGPPTAVVPTPRATDPAVVDAAAARLKECWAADCHPPRRAGSAHRAARGCGAGRGGHRCDGAGGDLRPAHRARCRPPDGDEDPLPPSNPRSSC